MNTIIASDDNESAGESAAAASSSQLPSNNQDMTTTQPPQNGEPSSSDAQLQTRELGPGNTSTVPFVQPGEEILQNKDLAADGGGGDDSIEDSASNSEPAAAAVAAAAAMKKGVPEPSTSTSTLTDSQAPSATPACGKSSKASSSRARFPDKLHRLLDDCTDDSQLSLIVSWMGQRAFKVHQPKQFAASILPTYFATTTYKSFQRNLNLWGFTCIAKGPRRGVCFHPFFVRGNDDDLSSHMKRSGDPTKLLPQRDQRPSPSEIPRSVAAAAEAGANASLGYASSLGALATGALPSSGSILHRSAPIRPLSMAGGAAAASALARMAAGSASDHPPAGAPKKRDVPPEIVTSDDASSAHTKKRRKAAKTSSGNESAADFAAAASQPEQQSRMALVQNLMRQQGRQPPSLSDSGSMGMAALQGGMGVQQLLAMTNRGDGARNDTLDSSNRSGDAANSNRGLSELLAVMNAGRNDESAALAELAGGGVSVQQLLQLAGGERSATAAANNALSAQQLLASQSTTSTNRDAQVEQFLALIGGGNDFARGTALSANVGVSPQLNLLLLQQLQQQQAQARIGTSSIANLVASMQQEGQGRNQQHLLQQQCDQTLLALLQGHQQSSLHQQLGQEQLSLQDVMRLVQQQQQNLAALELQRQRQQQQPQFIRELVQQLQDGALLGPPPLQLPPSAIQQQQHRLSQGSPPASPGQSSSLQHQTANALQQANIEQAGISTGASASGQSLQLQRLLQSFGSGLPTSTSALPSGADPSILEALQQQQQRGISQGRSDNNQQLLQLLQQRSSAWQTWLAEQGNGLRSNFNSNMASFEMDAQSMTGGDGNNRGKGRETTSNAPPVEPQSIRRIYVILHSRRILSSQNRNLSTHQNTAKVNATPFITESRQTAPESSDESGKSCRRSEWDNLLLQRPSSKDPSSHPVAE